MVCFVALSLTKRSKGKDTQKIGIEKNGTPAHQKQKDKKDTHKEKQKSTVTLMHTHEYITLPYVSVC